MQKNITEVCSRGGSFGDVDSVGYWGDPASIFSALVVRTALAIRASEGGPVDIRTHAPVCVPSAVDHESELHAVVTEAVTYLRRFFIGTGHGQEADDLAHDVVVQALSHPQRLLNVPAAERRIYLLGIAKNLGVNKYRAREKRAEIQLDAAKWDALPQEAARPWRDVDLQSAWTRLAEREREILSLRYLCSLSIPDSAKVLGISPPAAKMRAYRALKALKTACGVCQ